jgi:hypothetical protein
MMRFPFDEHGILLRRRAVQLGYDDNWLLRMRRAGAIVRIRQGAYVDAGVWKASDPVQRHLLKCRAVMMQYDDRVALSHASEHLRAGGPDRGLDLTNVHVTNLFGRGDRTQAGVIHHRGECRVGDVTRWEDHWITAAGRTAVDTAASVDLVTAVSILDWTLHQERSTRAELEHYVHSYMEFWPMTVGLPVALERSDGRSESVGETHSRLLLEDGGYHPEPQFAVHHPSGFLAGVVDLVLRELGLMVEFDGDIKYGRLLKPGQTIADVIRAEREREKLLQELTGMWIIRLVWADLARPQETLRRIAALAAKRAAWRAS